MQSEFTKATMVGLKPTIVIIKGIQVSNSFFEPLMTTFNDHELYLINLYDFVEANDQETIESIANKVIEHLDLLCLHHSVFISTGIGNLISIKIGQLREDLVIGQVFTGTSHEQLDPDLMKVYEYALSFSMTCEDADAVRPLLKNLLVGEASYNESYTEDEVSSLLETRSQLKMLTLLKLRASQAYTKNDLLNYKIPNYIISADNDPLTYEEDVLRFTKSLGTNRGLFILQDFESNLALIMSKPYQLTVFSIIKRFKDHYEHFFSFDNSFSQAYATTL